MAYYAKKLSGERLRACYEIASQRVRQYLQAEIDHVLDRLHPYDTVLELGCGYGRVALELAKKASQVVGIDTATESLSLGSRLTGPDRQCKFVAMDATAMGFPDDRFDVVLCVQNGICAFAVDQACLVREAVRVCRPGGRILFSSYAERFWPHRLEWFEHQAAHGLLGEIDLESSGNGVIVCKDGFRAGFMRPSDFQELWASCGLTPEIVEVDASATFCESVIG
jgi:2-polyprenyl-6-hydroxyphenyl methylase/3-demethylubiquinone-9 3-methyltransferase